MCVCVCVCVCKSVEEVKGEESDGTDELRTLELCVKQCEEDLLIVRLAGEWRKRNGVREEKYDALF